VADILDILHFIRLKIHSVSKNVSLSVFRNTGRKESPLWLVLQQELFYVTWPDSVISYSSLHLKKETDTNSEKLCLFQTDVMWNVQNNSYVYCSGVSSELLKINLFLFSVDQLSKPLCFIACEGLQKEGLHFWTHYIGTWLTFNIETLKVTAVRSRNSHEEVIKWHFHFGLECSNALGPG
jgi:hypothetical protein